MVPHHSTDSAINCLTAQIGRDAVGLVVYGRNSKANEIFIFKYRPPISEGGYSMRGGEKGETKGRDLRKNFKIEKNLNSDRTKKK